MTVKLQFSRQDRLLVLAPHPDDETLAAGEVIQCAAAAGAALRIVFATDGDNNPWPQRWLEKRWRIGVSERARWGRRRRSEAVAALGVLGVDAGAARFLGWPDQGLTDCLMRDDAAVVELQAEIAAFAPTHVVVPTLGDRHPDHSALRVMTDAALLRAGSAALRLGYVVHGEKLPADAASLPAQAARAQRKIEAMRAHASQIALSGRRLLELAGREEHFETVDAAVPHDGDGPRVLQLLYRDGAVRGAHELLLVLATSKDTLRFRAPLPHLARVARTQLVDAHGRAVAVERTADALRVVLPDEMARYAAVYAKLHRSGPRLVIFDRSNWYDARDLLIGHTPAAMRHDTAEFVV